MELAEEANNSLTSKIPSSPFIVDHSLSITHMKPKIVCSFVFVRDFIESLKRKVKRVEVGIGGNSFLGVRREVVNLKLLEFSGDFAKILQRELCKDLFNQWSNLDDSHFSVETVSGGITNLLLKVSVREDDGKNENMTVRLYGPNTECVNRERELLAIQHLSVAGFGANLLGVFGNGIVQSFIDAHTLTPSDLRNPKLTAEIAKQRRTFHQVQIPSFKEP